LCETDFFIPRTFVIAIRCWLKKKVPPERFASPLKKMVTISHKQEGDD